MKHMYFSARAEGRISYGHLGRTYSCFFFIQLSGKSKMIIKFLFQVDSVLQSSDPSLTGFRKVECKKSTRLFLADIEPIISNQQCRWTDAGT